MIRLVDGEFGVEGMIRHMSEVLFHFDLAYFL